MKAVVIYCLIAVAFAEWFEESYERHKHHNGHFKTKYHIQFAGWSEKDIKYLMGSKLQRKPEHASIRTQYTKGLTPASIPTSFDSSQKWPNCASTFGFIKDQGHCGSCWAVSASNVIAGRICIAQGGTDPNVNYSKNGNYLNEPAPPIDFSAQQIASCCTYCSEYPNEGGCGGGWFLDAMVYAHQSGIVTGGWYGSNCGCYPYQIDPTNFTRKESNTPACQTTCPTTNYPQTIPQDRHYAYDHYHLSSDSSQIQNDIMTYGPVECGFEVYENFLHYSSGVYDHKDGKAVGGHGVTLYGWGILDGIPYWTIHNSWNITWGMKGKVLFKRGVDLCGIEDWCVAARYQKKTQSWGLRC